MTNRLKISLLLLAVMLWSGVAQAQSFMTIFNANGSPMASYSLPAINKVTFDGANMIVATPEGNQEIDMNNVLSVKFTDQQQTAVEKISTDDATTVRIATSRNSIAVLGATSGAVAIYAVNGQQVYSNRQWRGESINTAHLQPGIYIITINNSTFKFKK